DVRAGRARARLGRRDDEGGASMKAAVLLPSLAGRDAVGNDTLAMVGLLRERGVETRVFCEHVHGVSETTHAPQTLPDFAGGPDDLVLYHFSTGWPLALDLLARVRGRRVVRYHNIT